MRRYHKKGGKTEILLIFKPNKRKMIKINLRYRWICICTATIFALLMLSFLLISYGHESIGRIVFYASFFIGGFICGMISADKIVVEAGISSLIAIFSFIGLMSYFAGVSLFTTRLLLMSLLYLLAGTSGGFIGGICKGKGKGKGNYEKIPEKIKILFGSMRTRSMKKTEAEEETEVGVGVEEDVNVVEPFTDIIEGPEEIIVKMDLPGVSKEDLILSIKANSIEVEAKRKEEKAEEGEEKKKKGWKYIQRERDFDYQCLISLPGEIEIDVETAEAKVEGEGCVLSIRLPKTKIAKERRIKVE